ncbi:hypothetical protein [Roseibium sp.]|uniref:DUF6932 family protein n=1 Tax=Roseibium sp. TaxID=1936156 RepID=UPI001B087101|nr:hypothetical protein [Roseibium sp.]MBO6856457.1 hypothetical protein [Roseibium sp.]
MAIGRKFDYPPLLPPGRHFVDLMSVKKMFLDTQKNTNERRNAYYRFEVLVQALMEAAINCEIWLNGSFLTEKPDPSDTDVTVILEKDVASSLSQTQRDIIDRIEQGRFLENLDSFVFVRLLRDDEGFGDDFVDPAYTWGEQYGCQNDQQYLKGYVVLRLGENHVGLRICS